MPPPEPLEPKVGRAVLHLFGTVGPDVDASALTKAVETLRQQDYQVVTAAMLGHKADVAVMAVGPDVWRLRSLQTDVVAAGVRLTSSYASVTEISEYAAGLPDELRRARLYPELPPRGKRAFCFYPMSKRRRAQQNWYALDFERRRELMLAHGAVGREFRGRILQLITASTGLDDWEWGVTLFAVTPDDLKDCVYRMRFDQASALYAEFGPFYIGIVDQPDVVVEQLVGR